MHGETTPASTALSYGPPLLRLQPIPAVTCGLHNRHAAMSCRGKNSVGFHAHISKTLADTRLSQCGWARGGEGEGRFWHGHCGEMQSGKVPSGNLRLLRLYKWSEHLNDDDLKESENMTINEH